MAKSYQKVTQKKTTPASADSGQSPAAISLPAISAADGKTVAQSKNISAFVSAAGPKAPVKTALPAFAPVQKKKNNTGLPDQLKSGIESLSGQDISDVKVHYNSSKPSQLHAHAYAQGTDIHVAPGQEKHLPHEAWHTVQQKQGRVQATMQMKQGVPVNDDTGLENEADAMGAKAMAVGAEATQKKEIAQMRFNPSLLTRNTVQRMPVAQRDPESDVLDAPSKVTMHPRRARSSGPAPVPELLAFNQENAGMINIINNAGTVLSSTNWTASAPGMGVADGVLLGTEIAGGATGASGSATNAVKGAKDVGSSAIGAAGHVVQSVGSSIGALVSAVKAIKTAVEESDEAEASLVGGTKAAQALLSALKSGFEAAASVQRFVSGGVSPGIMAAIPGLGLAIAACDVIMNAYSAYNAKQAEEEMGGMTGEFKTALTALIGVPEEKASLFAQEKRGKFGNRITYLRLKPEIFETLDQVMADKTNKLEANFRRKHGIPPGVSFPALYAAIKQYELGSKMQEINQKRKVQGARNIFASVIRIAGEIAKFFPADGGITAGVLMGTSAAIGAAQSVGKLVQGLARDGVIGGGDKTRSSAAKHKEYLNHTRSIYQFLDAIPKPVTPAVAGKMNTGKQLLAATGVNVATVLATDYSNSAQVQAQVDMIVKAMKAGR